MEDVIFNSSGVISGQGNFSSGILTLTGVRVGCFSLEDEEGNLIYTAQKQVGQNAQIDLSMFEIGEAVWKVRFPRGQNGKNTSGGISDKEAILYSLIFG